ncbi:glycoside hydrolase family 16 protein [Xylariomycetidae sp. FL0641]|nr:glycoside hydrolase family 16 protein [Xylariomycetidae sp. FL0641]
MSSSLFRPAVALLAFTWLAPAACQLFTNCNPLNETCPPNPALSTSHTWHFNSTPSDDVWNTTAGTIEYDAETGAAFTISKRGQSPTLISNFYFFFGRTEVWLKAAPGQGIISSIVWSSDDLDEVDWEFLGGNTTAVSSNYYGKGVMNNENAEYYNVDGIQDDYHNYTCYWTKDILEWHIDGKLVRSLTPDEANNTLSYPQTPMMLSMGIWAGGDPSLPAGTISWAGGETDFDAGPYTMYVKSASVEDFSTGKEYKYGDMSGSMESIEIVAGNSTAEKNINKVPEKSIGEKWDELPSATKSGVYVAAAGVGALAIAGLAFYYFRQRKAGQQEAALLAAREEQDRMELERFKAEGRDPDELAFDGTPANKAGVMGSTSYAVLESPPASSAGPPEKAWDPTGPGAVRSPLMQEDHPGSPPMGSPPTAYTGAGFGGPNSPPGRRPGAGQGGW